MVLPPSILLTRQLGGNNFVYLPNLADVLPGTVAAACIAGPDYRGFVVLTNYVNYAVTGDGSVPSWFPARQARIACSGCRHQ